MTCGFTGTQHGMKPRQLKAVRQLLFHVSVLHLGDCIGADAEAHAEAVRLGVKTVGHLPDDGSKRAHCTYDEERAPKPYLTRNRVIVAEGVDGLIAAPRTFIEPVNKRGEGTWTTVVYARQAGRKIWTVLPDGTVREEGPEPRCCDGNDPACPVHGVAASNARQNEFYKRNPRG